MKKLYITVSLFLLVLLAGINCKAGNMVQAIADNDLQKFARLYNDGDNLNWQDDEREGMTALMAAARYGSVDLVNTLLRLGADPNIQDDNGLTALQWAEKGKAANPNQAYEYHQKAQMIQKFIDNPVLWLPNSKVLIDEDNVIMQTLRCDNIIETKHVIACQEKKGVEEWHIYNPYGKNLDLIFADVKALSFGNNQYFILKMSNEKSYTVKDGYWRTLKSGLKQVKPEITDGGIIFKITAKDGKKEVYKP